MQKKLIALALASLAGSAFAQSNVTIYGVADATFDVVKTSDATEPSHTRISTNSSYLGFKGAEDLGNGLKAVFQFEGGIGFDGGGAWGGSNRDSFVGLAGGFGTIVAGNLTGPTRALGAAVDVNAGATGIGANSGILGKFGGLLQADTGLTTNAAGNVTATPVLGLGSCNRSQTCTSPFDTRFKNSIAYVSPNFSGFSVVAAYVANENKVDGGINTWGYDVGAKYENGPIMVGLTFNEVKDAIATDLNVSDLRLAGSYNFGSASIRALFERVRVKGLFADSEHQNTWGIGGTFNVTPAGKIIAQYYRANDTSVLDATGATLWEVGYEHSLSKRTILKAVYANLNSKENAGYQFGVNSGAPLVVGGETQSGFQFGVRHSF